MAYRQQGNRIPQGYGELMPNRIRNILLVASLYDSFTFQDHGGLTEMLFEKHRDLNLASFPVLERVSTPEEAIQKLAKENFDLVIVLLRVSGSNIFPFINYVKTIPNKEIPILLLATSASELSMVDSRVDQNARIRSAIDSSAHINETWKPNPTDLWMWPFIWQGDVRLFVAMIKMVEDRLNVIQDITIEPEIKIILLVEDNVKFYSSYLPMLYTELVKQQQSIMADTLTPIQQLKRSKARPKIILANTFEEGRGIYQRFKENILCLILDMSFPREGKHSEYAGLEFGRMVRAENPVLPIMIQSQDKENKQLAKSIDAHFIHKLSSSLLHDFREFLFGELGFGPFQFRLPNNGKVLATANDIRSFTEILETGGFSDITHSFIMHQRIISQHG